MRRRLGTFAAMSALALALSASPALAAPVGHFYLAYNAVDQNNVPYFPPVVCANHTYTLVSGGYKYVARDPSLAAHVTSMGTWATDEKGQPYHVVGAETYADPGGRFVSKLRFINQGGGITDSVNIVIRFDPAQHQFYVDFGTCGF